MPPVQDPLTSPNAGGFTLATWRASGESPPSGHRRRSADSEQRQSPPRSTHPARPASEASPRQDSARHQLRGGRLAGPETVDGVRGRCGILDLVPFFRAAPASARDGPGPGVLRTSGATLRLVAVAMRRSSPVGERNGTGRVDDVELPGILFDWLDYNAAWRNLEKFTLSQSEANGLPLWTHCERLAKAQLGLQFRR